MSGESAEQSTRVVGGRYELEALIGKGGVGEVWRARHVALNSRVAIKFLQPASAQKESAKRRFTTEAQVTAQLKTPSAVQVFDFGVTDEGQPYLVMELLEGETLGLRLQRVKRLSVAETARVLAQAARALARAHQLGIVHRDFKPDNIVIYEDDEGREQVKVLDFGVAKLVGSLEEEEVEESDGGTASEDSSMFTKTGAVLGTPLYMAPEQIRDATHVDLRADIWALGVVAFECLTGRPPFLGSTLLELFARIQKSQRASATFIEPSVPPGFDAWFDVACATDPARRFPNVTSAWKQLAVALEIPGTDSSPSLGSFDANASSGERRVLIVRDAREAEESAPTLEGQPSAAGELKGRTHDGGFASLQRISLDELPAQARGSVPSDAPRIDTPRTRGPTRHAGALWLTGFGLVAALGAVAVWRVSALSGDRQAPATAAPNPSSAPPPPAPLRTASAPAPTAVPAASTVAAPSTDTPPASVATSVRQPPPRAAVTPYATRLAATPRDALPSPSPAPLPAPPPSPPAATAQAPAPAPTDPGSYR